MTTQEQRAAVVKEALTWQRTKWHHAACVKGVGVDCARLLEGVFVNAGVVAPFEVEYYPQDWHMHNAGERLIAVIEQLGGVERPAGETPEPGDVVVWRINREAPFSHAAIVIEWPVILHAMLGRTVSLDDADACAMLRLSPRRCYTLRTWRKEQ